MHIPVTVLSAQFVPEIPVPVLLSAVTFEAVTQQQLVGPAEFVVAVAAASQHWSMFGL